jgi:short-subunit dehydrogenase
VVLGITSGLASALPTSMLPASSAYAASKLALCKVMENLAAENPDVFVATVHPGMVETAMFTKSGAKADSLPMDKGTYSQLTDQSSFFFFAVSGREI